MSKLLLPMNLNNSLDSRRMRVGVGDSFIVFLLGRFNNLRFVTIMNYGDETLEHFVTYNNQVDKNRCYLLKISSDVSKYIRFAKRIIGDIDIDKQDLEAIGSKIVEECYIEQKRYCMFDYLFRSFSAGDLVYYIADGDCDYGIVVASNTIYNSYGVLKKLDFVLRISVDNLNSLELKERNRLQKEYNLYTLNRVSHLR